MYLKGYRLILVCLFLSVYQMNGLGQISPGDLAKVHAHLEGMKNCTKCHELGDKVANEKCLDCHVEIKVRLARQQGFHASAKVKSKSCVICHSDHYGRNYDIVHLQKDQFDHKDTGYKIEGKHFGKDCALCHKAAFIQDPEMKKKQETYLGLSPECVTCHQDNHTPSLSQKCQNCHTVNGFAPASLFDHNNTKFRLKGSHATVSCEKCHPQTQLNGRKGRQFSGILFQNCSNCHKDPHETKFGNNCVQCHTEVSFKAVKSTGPFDHNKTGFPLEGRHVGLECRLCHKGASVTLPVKHERCLDCHQDYHKGQFRKDGKVPDCTPCHTTKGFQEFSFSLEQHNRSRFKLEEAHLATPCIDCHKKAKDWSFQGIGMICSDCHNNIHNGTIDAKYNPGNRCEYCHRQTAWSEVQFDHQQTGLKLEGRHANVTCRKCHFRKNQDGIVEQKFGKLDFNCKECHLDTHHGQFNDGTPSYCTKCHGFDNWKPEKFNHNQTKFSLDGGHKQVACLKCHKIQEDSAGKYINYQLKDTRCVACHLR